MKTLILLLALIPSMVSAREMATHQSLADVLEEIRDPVFNSQKRREILDFSRRMMARKLSKEMNVPEGELSLAFVKNPTHSSKLLRDPWYDVQTQFYTTLHQENFYQRWLGLQKLVKFTPYGKSIVSTMMGTLGQYSPVREGRYYVRWNEVSINSGGRNRSFNVPYFLMSGNIQELIQMEAHVPFEEIFPAKDISPTRPGLQTFIRNTPSLSRIQRQELAEKMELNHRVYIRAVANGAKTIASIHYLTGALNRHQTLSKVDTFIESVCEGCSQSEKTEYQSAAMHYVDNMKKAMGISSVNQVVGDLCKSLKSNQYHWNIDRLKPTPAELLMDQTKLANYYVIHKLKGKNREAIAKTIISQDMGILFLTNAINVLDKNLEPVATKLQCTTSSLASDAAITRRAITEAESNIQNYITRVNRLVSSARFNLASTNAALEYFVQSNQSATIESTSAYPQGIGWILKSIAELDQDVRKRKKMDKVMIWGGMIVGAGLTLTGIGAPEGVAIIAATANIVKGVSAGSYFLIRTKQEKAYAYEMRIAKAGAAIASDHNLQHHYSTYKSLKVQYIKEFGQSAFSFARLHRIALNKAGGDPQKAYTLLGKVLKTGKKTGAEEGAEVFQEWLIDLVANS